MITEQIYQLTKKHNYFEIRYCKVKGKDYWQYYGPWNEDIDADSLEELLNEVIKYYSGKGGW